MRSLRLNPKSFDSHARILRSAGMLEKVKGEDKGRKIQYVATERGRIILKIVSGPLREIAADS
jgi:DNA-binding MarR family transcriptional regulator